MPTFAAFQIAVDSTHHGVRVLIVAGVLDRAAAENVLRLVDAQRHLLADHRIDADHVVVDLAGVTRFEPGGMERLHAGRHPDAGSDADLRLHLAGCGGHLPFLPLVVRELLDDFSTFPTVDIALAQLCPPRSVPSLPRQATAPRITPVRPSIGATAAASDVKVILRDSSVELTARPADPTGATL